jgi:hypothetical protein
METDGSDYATVVVRDAKRNPVDYFIIDRRDLEFVSRYKWRRHSAGYFVSGSWNTGTGVYLHRLLIPRAERVDHINEDKRDNRRVNLRACSHQENLRNKSNPQQGSSNPHLGVCRAPRDRWRAYISVNRRQISLGYYASLEDAIQARIAGERKYFGDFAPKRLVVHPA